MGKTAGLAFLLVYFRQISYLPLLSSPAMFQIKTETAIVQNRQSPPVSTLYM